jgi:hypothetical protein
MVRGSNIRAALRHGALAAFALGLMAGVVRAEARLDLIDLEDARCGSRCPQVIQIDGEITRKTAERFLDMADRAARDGRLKRVVFVHSPGGDVWGSLLLGAAFRDNRVVVVVARARADRAGGTDFVSARCHSACVYAMMGGVRRVIPPQSRVGVHRMEGRGEAILDARTQSTVFERLDGSPEMVGALQSYARTMGVNPALIALAESVPHRDIRVLTRAEIRRFRLGAETM